MPERQSISDLMSRFGLRLAPYRGDDQKEQTSALFQVPAVGETVGETRESAVTVRVTTLKGLDAGRYYTERLPSYYLSSGEAPGLWWGGGADRLALRGQLEPEEFLTVMAGEDPVTGEQLGRRFGQGSVRGYDATFSAPKSVSLLFALGDEAVRDHVVEAHEGAVDAVLGWVEDHAHTRMRVHGDVRTVDAEGIVVGVFRQHTSRALDPQLHTHAVIANRVASPDGRWLALDARTIKMDQRTMSALYHVLLRAELTGRLGVRWQPPEHGIAEIGDMPPEVLAEFSQRSDVFKRRLDVKLDRFRNDLGREPTDREQWRLEREAVLDSRPPKRHGPGLDELRDEWRHRVRGFGLDPDQLVTGAIGRQRRPRGIDGPTAGRMVDQAVAALSEGQSSWRPAEMTRELARVAPTTVAAAAQGLVEFLELLASQAVERRCVDISRPVPAGVELRRDGRPVTEAAVDRALTTGVILEQEEQLADWAQLRLTEPSPATRLQPRFGLDGLSPGQQEAASAVAGFRGLELVVGPAGTGKTTALAAAAKDLRIQGRAVFGVAPTAAAAEVLAAETGMAADTLDKLLAEYHHPARPAHPEYRLPAGTTVILDEAGSTATPKLAALAGLADRQGWRVVMVGDPRQFSAVGRGGMFAHLVDSHGAVDLDQVHRFRHHWERQASLRLRIGDHQALVEYDRHGRLHGGTQAVMESELIDAWRKARGEGQSVALMANTTDTVTRLNQLAQQSRIMNGELDINSPWLKAGGSLIFVGDEVATRRNDRRLRTDRDLMVKNRDHWTITDIYRDRSVTVTGSIGSIRLPAEYVSSDVELGYAQTSHASQGRTVDISLLLVDSPTDSRGVYTPMTRGREANHAYVITKDNQTALDVLGEAISRDWIDHPALARRHQLDPHRARQPVREGPGAEPEVDERMKQIQQALERGRARRQAVERSRSLGRGL
ncbi:MAG TPA: MobF family relaxase [Acidimicrobiia bacterium]|nr:MobF family relaxase [Acidimicrobiia bacterium]